MNAISKSSSTKLNANWTHRNLKYIQTINEVLTELRDFFTGCESDHLLHLAEEPDPDHDISGITNCEMDFLLSAYHITLDTYLYGHLRARKKTIKNVKLVKLYNEFQKKTKNALMIMTAHQVESPIA